MGVSGSFILQNLQHLQSSELLAHSIDLFPPKRISGFLDRGGQPHNFAHGSVQSGTTARLAILERRSRRYFHAWRVLMLARSLYCGWKRGLPISCLRNSGYTKKPPPFPARALHAGREYVSGGLALLTLRRAAPGTRFAPPLAREPCPRGRLSRALPWRRHRMAGSPRRRGVAEECVTPSSLQ